MLSISAMSGGQGAYYTGLAREDYYLAGGEPPGIWVGKGAPALGLTGQVDKEALARLFAGFDPASDKALVQNAGADSHRPGWDLTFSAPKSVSVLWSQADQETANEIRAAQQESVEKALAYLETETGVTRRGKAGIIKEPAQLVISTFEHGTSRAQDPQLHTHALVLNLALRTDGSTGSIEPKGIYQHKMAAGALYRAELSHQLQTRLGLEIERSGSCFEVTGVPKSLIDEFSKRRAEIESVLDQKGFTSSKAAEMAAVSSREAKEHLPREELFKSWKETGRSHGFTAEKVKDLEGRFQSPSPSERSQRKDLVVSDALGEITNHHAHFPARDFVRYAAQEAQGRGLSSAEVLAAVNTKLESEQVVKLKASAAELRFTTREMIEVERHLIDTAKNQSKDRSHIIKDLEKLDENTLLNSEQREAVRHLTGFTGAIGLVSGMAGTGKTTMLKACGEIWGDHGFDVIGTSLSGKAADGLQAGAGIPSVTIAKLLQQLDKPDGIKEIELNPKTILVVDEAGMVGTRQMDQLVSRTSQANAKLVLVGDARQLQPIEAGGAFGALARELGQVELVDIRRQSEPWMRDVVKDMAGGRAGGALDALAKAGQVEVCRDRNDAVQKLLDAWQTRGVEKPEDNLIVASTNEDARLLNREAQQTRLAAGNLGKNTFKANGETFFEGDRLLFNKNAKGIGVKNGNLGTITRIKDDSVTVMVGDRFRTFSPLDYDHVSLGYAVTTHKAQGVTTENAYLLTNELMQDRELSYVQISRAKQTTILFTTEAEAGAELSSLARTMNKSRQKNLATDLINLSDPSINSQDSSQQVSL